MKEIRNLEKLENILIQNGGFITRKDVDTNNVPSWFLSDFVKKKELIKVAPGFYATKSYPIDEHFVFQKKYSKFIFSRMTSLYLLGLTDKIPSFIEVTGPIGYNPIRKGDSKLIIHRVSDKTKYTLGIIDVDTMYGNSVRSYDPERTVCDIVKHRKDYDSETFVKAIRLYVQKYNNQTKLFKYSRILGVENELFDVMEVIL